MVKEFECLGTMSCKYGEMNGEIRESCEGEECHRIICKNFGRKECVHGG